ncbi:MAG: efflux RND transporter periplasmic adaptor subunit [Thermodesulfobacteriota bacterium]|nr:efflux RND transporter periplasmic adaptor subunit [Thermodesulfobacteriota bacterium]
MKYRKFIVFAGVLFVVVLLGLRMFSTLDLKASINSHDDLHHDEHGHDDHKQEKSSQVTVWSGRFEIFLEHAFLAPNTPTEFITHVSDLVTLEPRNEGPMTFVMSYGSETPIRHTELSPSRDGIYIPELSFPKKGQWKVSLLIPLEGKEHIVEIPPFKVYGSQEEIDQAPFPEEIAGISFLKEQQWEIKTKAEPALVQKEFGKEILMIPESALIDEDGNPVAFVQLAGETFEKRYLKVCKRENGFVQVLSGLSKGEYVVTKGAYAVARAEYGKAAMVHLRDEQARKFGIEVDRVASGDFEVHISVPGEIVLNADRMVHIVPRAHGIVREVKKKIGDSVKAGEVMAIIESQDLADVKATYLASVERFKLTNTIFKREKKLWKDQISSEQEYLDAKNAFAEAKIQMRSAEHKLHTFGFESKYIEELPSEPPDRLTMFQIKAPLNGTVIKKHITLGEIVEDNADVFVVADLDTVWVDLQVHQKDIDHIDEGQVVTISAKSGVPETKGLIDYIDPMINKKTRTALVRMEVENSLRKLRPGTFITANILVERPNAELMIAKDILQDIDHKTCVFVRNGNGFEPRPVTVGRFNDKFVEIVSGLKPGEVIVTKNSFRLKTELEKTAGGNAGHGHAH